MYYNLLKTTCMHYRALSYDPYGPASAFFAKALMKVPYEGRTYSASGAGKCRTALLQKHTGSRVKTLKGPSQPVCIAAVCYCYYPKDLISFTVQMTRFVRIVRRGYVLHVIFRLPSKRKLPGRLNIASRSERNCGI